MIINAATPLQNGPFLFCICTIVGVGINASCLADDASTGPEGINSQNLGLHGNGVAIGMIENHRPGKHGFDGAANISSAYDPVAVFTIDQPPHVDFTHWHAVAVAGIVLAHPHPTSVSRLADFYAATVVHPSNPFSQNNWVLAAQRVGQEAGGNVRAINISTMQDDLGLNGASIITRGLDWSADMHEILYVVGRGNGPVVGPPADVFNGIVVGASSLHGNIFRHAWVGNATLNSGARRLTSILAPGSPITTTNHDASPGTITHLTASGTSLAAPHVTGTVALLQQYADTQSWLGGARRHEVMKAVLMNSADKLKDTNDGRRLCMEKDIAYLDNSNPPQEIGWLASDAYGPFTAHPVDDRMGTGQLNAKRALKQYAAGQFNSGGTVNVPMIGWDYSTTKGIDSIRKYVFEEPLEKESFISVTLAWDRVVLLNDTNANDIYDSGETFTLSGMTNMDLYLMPKDALDLVEAVAASTTRLYNVEHIFWQIPEKGEYEIWVHQATNAVGWQPYALAWWAVRDPGDCPADLNGDCLVDAVDIALLLEAWGDDRCGHPADLDRDGIVGESDLDILLDAFGSCPAWYPLTTCEKDEFEYFVSYETAQAHWTLEPDDAVVFSYQGKCLRIGESGTLNHVCKLPKKAVVVVPGPLSDYWHYGNCKPCLENNEEVGACCFGSGPQHQCQIVGRGECEEAPNGRWFGDGSNCDGIDCMNEIFVCCWYDYTPDHALCVLVSCAPVLEDGFCVKGQDPGKPVDPPFHCGWDTVGCEFSPCYCRLPRSCSDCPPIGHKPGGTGALCILLDTEQAANQNP